MDSKLVASLKNTIWDGTKDILMDFTEVGLDTITENEVLKEIPIVSTIFRLGNAVVAIRDRHLLKKTLTFVAEVNDGTISNEKLRKHKEELEKNTEKMNAELESILVILDRINKTNKSIVLANFYKSYMDEAISFDWEDFCICAEMLEVFSMYDVKSLKDIYEKESYEDGDKFDVFVMQKFNGLGLVSFFNNMKVNFGGKSVFAFINHAGTIFYELGIQKSYEKILKMNDKGVF